MNERFFMQLWCVVAGILLIPVAAAGTLAGAHMALSVFVGGVWNLVNLWCLAHLLNAWLGPQRSRRRALGWLLVKFPLLYAVVFLLLRYSGVSLLGFGVGFTVVLVGALTLLAIRSRQLFAPVSHDR
jgi:hypothetical protein